MPFSFVEFVPTNFKFEIEEKDEEVQDVPVLTGRAAREAEIAKMMASLDDNPTYTKFKPTADQSAINANNENIPSGKKEQKIPSIATQLKLPITSSITLSTPSQSNYLLPSPTLSDFELYADGEGGICSTSKAVTEQECT